MKTKLIFLLALFSLITGCSTTQYKPEYEPVLGKNYSQEDLEQHKLQYEAIKICMLTAKARTQRDNYFGDTDYDRGAICLKALAKARASREIRLSIPNWYKEDLTVPSFQMICKIAGKTNKLTMSYIKSELINCAQLETGMSREDLLFAYKKKSDNYLADLYDLADDIYKATNFKCAEVGEYQYCKTRTNKTHLFQDYFPILTTKDAF